jgi:cellulose biosynthesis protein BcsQ
MSVVLVHSPKGGVGNSFIAAQLALHLASRGHEVSAIDFTFQDALKMHFGFMPSQTLPEMTDTSAEAVAADGVSLVQGHALGSAPAFRQRLARGRDLPFDPSRISILDVPADDRELVELLLPVAALRICTLIPTAASLAVLPKLGGDTPAMHLANSVFVLNQIDDRQRLSRHTQSFMRDLFGDQVIAAIRRDEAVNEALARFEPIAKYAPSSAVLPDLESFAEAIERRLGLVMDEMGEAIAASGARA